MSKNVLDLMPLNIGNPVTLKVRGKILFFNNSEGYIVVKKNIICWT